MMRKIDRYNYEEFFLDYLEGNLGEPDLKDLECFLAENPDLKKELDEMCLVEVEEEKIEFDKSTLKQIPFESNFDDFCVAKLEGDLSQKNELAFNNYLNENLIGQAHYHLYEKTKLLAETNIVYPDKEELKRKDRKLIPYWLLSGVGIAASVLILFTVWNTPFTDKNTNDVDSKVAYNDSVKKVIVETSNSEEEKELVVSKALNPKTVSKKQTVLSAGQNEKLVANSELINSKVEKDSPSVTVPDKKEKENQIKTNKIGLPEVVKTPEVKMLANAEMVPQDLETTKSEKIVTPVNSGLANLGMSWKSSVPNKKRKNSILYAVAKIGVDKIGEIAGKKVQLQKEYDSETEKTRVNFNTKGIGFSTSIK